MKNSFLNYVIKLTFVGIILAFLSGCRRIDDKQAMFRGNLSRTGVFASGGPTTLTELVWNFKTEGNASSATSMVIYDGVIYFGCKAYLYALNISTGEEIWKFQSQYIVTSPPAVFDETVYFGSCDGLYAIDSNSGQQRWKFKTEGKVWSSPIIHRGVVYFNDTDGNVFAVK